MYQELLSYDNTFNHIAYIGISPYTFCHRLQKRGKQHKKNNRINTIFSYNN